MLCCVVLVLLKPNPFISLHWPGLVKEERGQARQGEICVAAHTNTNKASPELRTDPVTNTLQMCYSVTRPRDIQVREEHPDSDNTKQIIATSTTPYQRSGATNSAKNGEREST